MSRTPLPEFRQYLAFSFLSAVAIAAAASVSVEHPEFFRRYFGTVDPALSVASAALAGGLALAHLRSRGWFEIYIGQKTLQGLVVSAALATAFAAVAIAADLTIGFPRDINVPLPWSLLFYPAIGFVVEAVFHAVPLALLAFLFKSAERPSLWFILPVALLEPAFQIQSGLAQLELSPAEIFVGIHVFIINALQIHVFRRYGFVTMYAFRLIYYAYWHVAWGYLRLELIF